MSYANFKPTIWSKYIQHELDKLTVFKGDCDYKFEGEAGEGKRLKILAAYPPTIGTYTGGNISAAETIADSSIYLNIDQFKYFHFLVDDIDKAQAMDGMMEAYMQEATRALAEDTDTFLAEDISTNAGAASASASGNTAAEMKVAIDTGLSTLWDNGVRMGKDKVTIYLAPWMYTFFQDQLISDKTANDQLVKNGIIGMYKGAYVKMTNNLYNDVTDDYAIIKTDKAYAFCDGINKTESYRPDLRFADAIKGLHTYGGKMVRPKEAYTMKLHNS